MYLDMSKKFFILLEEFSKKPTAEIGQLGKSISRLVTAGVPVPKAICIPTSTLKLIAKKNNLSKKIQKVIKDADLDSLQSKNKTIAILKRLVIKQDIPRDISREFLELYHGELHSSFVSIQGLIQNIRGDANVIDAFFEIWAEQMELIFTVKNIDKILFSSPVLIQQQIDSEISGQALTFDERDGDKKRFTIKGVWGIVDNNLDSGSTYFVDSRTFDLIKKSTKSQKTQFIRNLGSLKEQKLTALKQDRAILTNEQTKNLARTISKIKMLSISQLKIDWGMQNNVFFVNKIGETTYSQENFKKEKNTLKKIYVSVTKNQDMKLSENHAHGFCILNTGKLLSLLGDHPMKIAKTSQKKLLSEAISKSIIRYASNNAHLIYRSQNLTSRELLKLKHSSDYEVREPNPYLGLRGASRILGQPQIFNIELDIIKNLLEKTNNKISLLIPFSRSPNEFAQVIKLIEKTKLRKDKNFDVWLELSTPESAINIEKYPLKDIGGAVFNTKSIYSLMIGVDPTNDDIFSKYSENTSILLDLIKNVSNSLDNFSKKKSLLEKHKLLVDLTSFDLGILKDVVNESVEGIIVNPQVTLAAKKCIINEEEKVTS